MKERVVFRNFSVFVITTLSFALVIFSNTGYAQDEVIRVDTNLITIPTAVLSRDGRYVANLKKEDFQIFEDGVEQEIDYFEPTEQPFTILLLLDVSGSMEAYLGNLAFAANIFVRKLRPDDKLIAVTFSDQINILLEPTKIKDFEGRIKLKQKLREGDTVLYDAVDRALKKMRKIQGRKAIVLFSDGVGTGLATAKGTIRTAEEQEALIYTIKFGTDPVEPPSYVSKKSYFKRVEEIEGYMRDLAVKTGGRNYQIEAISDLEKTFGAIADELGQQYSLGYYPKTEGKKGERRQIKVKVRQPNLAVQARNGYVVGSNK